MAIELAGCMGAMFVAYVCVQYERWLQSWLVAWGVCLWPMFVYSMREGCRDGWLHGGMFVAYVCVQYERWL